MNNPALSWQGQTRFSHTQSVADFVPAAYRRIRRASSRTGCAKTQTTWRRRVCGRFKA